MGEPPNKGMELTNGARAAKEAPFAAHPGVRRTVGDGRERS